MHASISLRNVLKSSFLNHRVGVHVLMAALLQATEVIEIISTGVMIRVK